MLEANLGGEPSVREWAAEIEFRKEVHFSDRLTRWGGREKECEGSLLGCGFFVMITHLH